MNYKARNYIEMDEEKVCYLYCDIFCGFEDYAKIKYNSESKYKIGKKYSRI